MPDPTVKQQSHSSSFRPLEPFILDGDLENMLSDGDLACFDPSVLQSNPTDDDDYDDDDDNSRLLSRFYLNGSCSSTAAAAAAAVAAAAETSPSFPQTKSVSNFSRKRSASSFTRDISNSPSSDRSDSPEGSSHASSIGGSPAVGHSRDRSDLTAMSFAGEDSGFAAARYRSEDWLDFSHFSSPTRDADPLDSGLETSHDDMLDLEASNRAMDAAFDFESAAGLPNLQHQGVEGGNVPPPSDLKSASSSNNRSIKSPTAASPNGTSKPLRTKTPSRLGSPNTLNILTEDAKTDQWNIRSPTSEMEENLGKINMSGSSPATSAVFTNIDYSFGSADRIAPIDTTAAAQPQSPPPQPQSQPQPPSSSTPYSAASSAGTTQPGTSLPAPSSSTHREIDPSGTLPPVLIVHPTSQKSRVETQIPIRLTLCPLPQGVKKLRLPKHTVSKLKFFAKPDTPRSPDILELHANVVCTSTMQDQVKLENALARARGDLSYMQMNNDANSPLSGGDVKICPNCIKRERKRANRKKQRKPEEEEIFQRDEEKRIVVFNTTELRDWVEPPRTPGSEHLPPGTMQVELPMRIACYCRHQSEKLGFQVIFTIKDYQDKVVAQSITNSIMITDDHKTHATAAAQPVSSVLPDHFNLPGAGVFPAGSQMDAFATTAYPNSFRLSHSTTDLASMRQPSLFPHQAHLANSRSITRMPNGVAFPTTISRQSPGSVATSLSSAGTRHTSPVDRQGPSSKRRKHSGPGRIPPELAMTRLNGSHSSSPATAQDAQFKPTDRGFAMQPTTPSLPPSLSPGPQLAGDSMLLNQPTETLLHDMVSTPGSAHTSRPGSPSSGRPSDPRFSTAALSGNLFGITPPNSLARIPPAMIHKLVPAEGSTTGGSEVTILGSGFFPGMEVVFGDTLATTTTFWGDKCLNCLTPPALHPGRVQVTFKHEHPLLGGVQQPPQSIVPKQMIFFTYVDDRELQMYRLALGILGQKLGNPADAYQTAQQIMGSDTSALWNLPNGYANGGQTGGGGQQHQGGGYQGHSRSPGSPVEGRTNDLDTKMSEFLKFFDLDFSRGHHTNGGRDAENDDLLNTKSLSGGQTLLHFAASLDLVHFLNGLLLRGADPNAKDNNDNTPLHLAALEGDVSIVNRLRLGGADIHFFNKADMTPADLATTIEAHQALLTARSRRRTRSVGSSSSTYTHLRRRSLDSFWVPSASDASSDVSSSDGSKDESEDVSD
ncbi:hypothetical protein KEM56_006533, partial [Ascosphaera pollenicola]